MKSRGVRVAVASDDVLFMLASCYQRAHKPLRAYALLRRAGCPTVNCRFLFAQACFELGK